MTLHAIYEYSKDYLSSKGVDVSFEIDDTSLVIENNNAKVEFHFYDKVKSLSHLNIALRPLMEGLK